MEEEKDILTRTCEKVEETIEKIIQDDLQPENIEYLYQLVDIHKDIANEEYWKIKEEDYMRNYGNYSGYGNYGTYGRRGRDSRGRYSDGGSSSNYGRRYRGHDMIEEMGEQYGNYMESGRYNGQGSMEALEYMLQSAEDFFKHIEMEAKSPEEIEMVKRTARRISEM